MRSQVMFKLLLGSLLIIGFVFAGSGETPSILSRGDTLYYDDGTFNNGLGFYTTTGIVDPDPDSTYGFAEYFILSQFGLTDQKIVGIMLYFNSINAPQYNFRLYVWETQPSGLLPKSEGPHLYRDMNAVLPPELTWGYFDLSALTITLPDTFWIGVCYNHFTTGPPSDWFLAFNSNLADQHMFLNDMDDGTTGWVPASTWGYAYAYGVRAVVEDATGIGERHVLTPDCNSMLVSTISKNEINVKFSLAHTTDVKLTIYDAMGRICRQLIHEKTAAGTHNRVFNLNLASGAYFIHLETETGIKMSNKFLLLK